MTDQAAWRIAPAPYATVRSLAEDLGVSDVLAQVLVRRGFTDPGAAEAFLHPDYRVHNPFLMAGMRAARRRIDRALQLGEAIAIHGDYDADGITATFVLSRLLEELSEAEVRTRLPNRFTDGYGVSLTAVEELAEAGVRLLITVDCGITARAEVARARELGMDVIVTDHHEVEGELPECIVVSPKLGNYPCPHLAGVGVAFKLCHALLAEPEEPLVELPLKLRALTDVVAIGTIADLVPLVDENRVLATIGLGRLRSAPRPGLATLMEVTEVRAAAVGAGQVGFRLAPLLNAAGRLEDASQALALLAAEDRRAALPLALRLNELNRERQAIEAAILAEACGMVPEPLPPALVLSSTEWHEGVIGIVASRVAERFNRPTILLSASGDEAKGSGRSIAAFDILAAVEASAGHLLAFGGHRAACGVRLRSADIAAFREAFVAAVAASLGDALTPTRQVDAIVGGHELTLELADELELLAPHGYGNRAVTLLLHGAELQTPRLTRNGRHLQYRVRCHGATCPAIHFNFAELEAVAVGGRRDLLLTLGKNEYNGRVSAQVEVKGLTSCDDKCGDLCPTSCDASCRLRLSGEALWRSLLDDRQPAATPNGLPDAAAARLVDRRGRPLAPLVQALAGGGERVLVLVADVPRRRPLLSRELLPQQHDAPGLYLQSACRSRLPLAAGAAVVMAGYDLFAEPADKAEATLSGIEHVVFADPPFSPALAARVAHACPRAWFHLAWGGAELDFTGRIRQSEYDVQTTARRLWRILSAGSGSLDDALERQLLADGLLPPLATLAAAFRVLREAGLLHIDGGQYRLERPDVKVDITQTTSFTTWHTLFQSSSFPPNFPIGRR